jgi:hypothetical protein
MPKNLVPPNAKAYFDSAIEYKAAAELLAIIMAAPGNTLPLRDPTYHLYHHAVELVLKGYLVSKGQSVQPGHYISAYYDRCRKLGLRIADDVDYDANNLIAVLQQGNRHESYRYVGPIECFSPDLSWTREMVGRLLDSVEPHVLAWLERNPQPAPSRMTLSKPTHTKQPKPNKPG